MSLEVEGVFVMSGEFYLNGKNIENNFEIVEKKFEELENRLENRLINKKNILKIIELYNILTEKGLKEKNNIAEIIVISHEIEIKKND